MRVTSENEVRFILIDTGSIYKGIESSVLTAGWHHIVTVWDGIDEKIYVDDADDSQTAIENGKVIIIMTTANTKVGLDTTSAAHYFNGLIDEVRIWDKALQPEDILNSNILVEKSNSESAHVDDIITCTVTNTFEDVPLSVVTVSDDLVGDAVYVSGDDSNNFLEVGEIWIFTVNYVVTFNDPEWLINIATAIGTDELDVTVGDEYSWTIDTMGARTIGYRKTHPDTWCDFSSGSMFTNKKQEPVLLDYFPGNSAQVGGVSQLGDTQSPTHCFQDELCLFPGWHLLHSLQGSQYILHYARR